MRKYSLIYILFLFISGCQMSYSKIKNVCQNSHNIKISDLNGEYGNTSDSTCSLLLFELFQGKRNKIEKFDSLNIYLEFKEHEIVVYGSKNDSIIINDNISVQWNGHQFALRRKISMIGIPFIYFFCSKSKSYIGMDESNNLLINNGTTGFGMILFFAAGNIDYSCSTFKKITN